MAGSHWELSLMNGIPINANKNGRDSNKFVKFRVHVEQSSDGRGLDLVFRSIKTTDEGRYACEATLDGTDEHEAFKLNVIGKDRAPKNPV